ncbi:hypothetical protein AB0K67_11910 [Nonomuraea sp. NPDC052634]|uniref:hypothetical protein n=1 Tax=Nonomuraea sp. NPDC052634 TaxID=3155813 RepID=UPI00341D22A8
MHIEPIDLGRPGDSIEGLHEAFTAATAASGDDRGPLPSFARFSHLIRSGGAGARTEPVVVREDGKVAGGYALELYEEDNQHAGGSSRSPYALSCSAAASAPRSSSMRWTGCAQRAGRCC